jgi:hypothetical protein
MKFVISGSYSYCCRHPFEYAIATHCVSPLVITKCYLKVERVNYVLNDMVLLM